MADEQPKDQPTVKRDRSPSFPYIGLAKALERIQIVHEKARRTEVRVADVAKDWGLAPKSSSTDRNVAALLAYGLIEDSGSGDNRKIKLSDVGSRIIDDKRPGVREKLLAEAALRPKIIAEYHSSLWKDGRPDDNHSISALKFDAGFTDEGARMFLRVFDETIRFAQGSATDSNAATKSDTEVGGSAMPAMQGNPTAGPTPIHQQQPTMPTATQVEPAPAGIREERFALKEGDVRILFPRGLSSDSVGDLEAYLEIFLKKARREAGN
jgi:hypothetical protein